MNDIKSESDDIALDIRNRIRGKVTIAGIGNIIRGDDGLGPKLIELLKARGVNAGLFDCGTAPENYILPMLKSLCDTLILVDAANMALEPGTAMVLDTDDIANVSFSTHSPSPKLFIDLLKMGKEDLNVFVLSVQPKSTTLGSPMSEEVLKALTRLSETLSQILV
ncbi:MAG: hydrogenase maturation protease [Candidatus Omnitrophica bacterium]|nr:hydrogenase maturation protease [Candidatus Omnitrophota bacterium]MBU0895564.1 hydrogenase maturation protease [Candidatus Omnitrophota bacterium]MBU1808012.1 hydrogenase maturation protease [Candidatus Omnitrophota bacterium]